MMELPMPPDPPIVPGTIFYASWGYDQTNIEYFQVISVSPSGKSVTVRKLMSKTMSDPPLPGEASSMTGTEVPFIGMFAGEPKQYKIHPRKGSMEPFLKMETYKYAYRWDGRPRRCSWYG